MSRDTCRRCGHHLRRQSLSARLHRVLPWASHLRVLCGFPTPAGWACPCRSRAHQR